MSKEPIKIISRKDFLKRAGLTLGGVTAGSLLFTELMAVPQSVLERLASSRGEESFINTVCGLCPAGCGLRVRRIDGIPIGVKGNELSPVNRGGVCPMAYSAAEHLFHPDRVHEPQVRSGRGKSVSWQATSWENAINGLSDRLREAVGAGTGNRVAMINGGSSPLTNQLCRHFMAQLGSANYFETGAPERGNLPVRMSHNVDYTPVYDFANARHILNFGDNFLEEGNAPVYFQRMLGEGMAASRSNRLSMHYIDSRMNLTAASADRWIPIRPGTYGALALGLAYVLIVDRLYNVEFIRSNCHGFDSFQDKQGQTHIGFKAFVKANYYPEKVAEITGVPAKVIIELGEYFGSKGPALALAGEAVRYSTNGSFAEWAVYCLNALVGNIQEPGGVYFRAPGMDFPLTELPALPVNANQVGSDQTFNAIDGPPGVDQFLKAVADADDSLIDTLIVIDANPLYNSRMKATVRKAFARVGQVVILGTIMDETAQLGQLFLPGHSWLENTDLTGSVPDLFFSYLGYQQQAIKPLFDTRAVGDVILSLGNRVVDRKVFEWGNYASVVDAQLKTIFESARGAVISKQMDARWLTQLHERGWQLQQYDNFTEFKRLIQESGGWWDPLVNRIRKRDLYQNDSGKFEFVSSYLQSRLAALAQTMAGESEGERLDRVLSLRGISVRGDHLDLPHHEALAAGQSGYNLILTTSWQLANRYGKGAAFPSLLELLGIHSENYWQSWVEVNPLTGRANRLHDRHYAWVASESGRLKVKVRYYEGIQPGVVHLHMGLGHTDYGRYSNGVGVNVTDIIDNKYESLSGAPALNGTMVKVIPTTEEA